ncbi:GNAT family N-acetyltransferase [Hymenobacter setariae]|uniref:GNAT family N-acetyltransferase n=1 Tax=Hymenobacter setariae TaxID=2594794 RepID=A0A558C1S2_9BACT|nr:GNAT family N-acetyltransferase [Hymenobacter setariae]TVT42760.1 GNAT family N-acetyltransferase [Hymenobacter setariae]
MHFTLRPWGSSDLSSLVRHANNAAVARNLADIFPHPYTEADGLAYIEFATSQVPGCIFAIEVAGEAVGSIALHPQTDIHRKNAELGYWLGQSFWGHGICTRAVREVVAYSFHTFDLARIFARPFGTNRASQRVLEKAGFLLEAQFSQTLFKNGEFIDEWVYGVRRETIGPGHTIAGS